MIPASGIIIAGPGNIKARSVMTRSVFMILDGNLANAYPAIADMVVAISEVNNPTTMLFTMKLYHGIVRSVPAITFLYTSRVGFSILQVGGILYTSILSLNELINNHIIGNNTVRIMINKIIQKNTLRKVIESIK
jgi:hypothetical protein